MFLPGDNIKRLTDPVLPNRENLEKGGVYKVEMTTMNYVKLVGYDRFYTMENFELVPVESEGKPVYYKIAIKTQTRGLMYLTFDPQQGSYYFTALRALAEPFKSMVLAVTAYEKVLAKDRYAEMIYPRTSLIITKDKGYGSITSEKSEWSDK